MIRWLVPIVLTLGCNQIFGIGGRDPGSRGDGGGNGDDAGDASFDAVVTSSCGGPPDTCGAHRNEPCCLSLNVPGGMFYREYDAALTGSLDYPATVSDFALDKFDVTVGRFRVFVEAGYGTQAKPPELGGGAHAKIADSGWSSAWTTDLPTDTAQLKQRLFTSTCAQGAMWTSSPGAHENRPMNCMSWAEAMAFCIWDGGYLPTQAEWQYASAGGSQQRVYPWSVTASSMTIDPTYAVYEAGEIQNVGSTPNGNGRYGQADLTGNLSQFVLDWYGSFHQMPQCDDCALLGDMPVGSTRQLVGGTFDSGASRMRVVGNSDAGAGTYFGTPYYGFRCARALQ